MDLEALNIQQLNLLKQQLEGEIERLAASFGQLRHAGTKYRAARLMVDQLKEGQVLVPLTSSVYVPGRVKNPDKLLVDIGTGYYVEMNTQATKELCERKMKMLRDNMDAAGNLINQRRRTLDVVVATMQKKAQSAQ